MTDDYRAGGKNLSASDAGGGAEPGEVTIPGEAVIQTYSPDHYSIVAGSHAGL